MNMKSRSIGVGVGSILAGSVAITGCSSASPHDPASDGAEVESASSALSVENHRGRHGCDTPEGRARRLEPILRSPIRPPDHVGGIDLDQGEFGITFEQFSAIACDPVAIDPPDFLGNFTAYWGENRELELVFNPSKDNALRVFAMHPGYTGKARFHSRCGGKYGNHEYTIGVGVIERDGKPYPVDFSLSDEQVQAHVTEIYDAAIATFQPDEAPVDNCFTARTCLIVPDDTGGESVVGLRGNVDFYWVTPLDHPHVPSLVYKVWRPAN